MMRSPNTVLRVARGGKRGAQCAHPNALRAGATQCVDLYAPYGGAQGAHPNALRSALNLLRKH